MKALQHRTPGASLQIDNIITGDLYDRYAQYIDGSPKTVETYTRAARQFYKWMQRQGITQPTREDVLSYREQLRQTVKPATTQAYIIAVRLFFKWTEQEGFYPNISDKIKGAKIDREHKKDPLTTTQVKDILDTIDTSNTQGKRDYAIITLAVTGGTRTIELQRANIEDMRTAGDSTVLYIQGKGREERTQYVKLPRQVEKAIRIYIKARGNTRPGDPLFASSSDRNKGTRLTTKSISRLIKTRFIQAGYDDSRLTAHSLRHTAGTVNLMNGGTLEETQQLLRHSNINTTMIYLHHLDRAKNQSEDRIANAIF